MQLDYFKHGRDIIFRDWFWNAVAARLFTTGKSTERLCHSRTLLVRFPGHDRGNGAAKRAAFHAVVAVSIAHHQRSEIRVAQPKRSENVRVLRDLLDRITGVIDHDFLRSNENPHRGFEPLDVELSIGRFKFEQI